MGGRIFSEFVCLIKILPDSLDNLDRYTELIGKKVLGAGVRSRQMNNHFPLRTEHASQLLRFTDVTIIILHLGFQQSFEVGGCIMLCQGLSYRVKVFFITQPTRNFHRQIYGIP